MAFYVKRKCIVVSLDTWLSTSGEIRIITNDMQHDSAEYGLQTCHIPIEGSSVLTIHVQPICDE
jgi:hypothetical protein